MKPIKVICPICGEEMFAISWGMQRQMYRGFSNEAICTGETDNYANYDCSCGNKMTYRGRENCWQKKCKCKSCKNFQEVKDE